MRIPNPLLQTKDLGKKPMAEDDSNSRGDATHSDDLPSEARTFPLTKKPHKKAHGRDSGRSLWVIVGKVRRSQKLREAEASVVRQLCWTDARYEEESVQKAINDVDDDSDCSSIPSWIDEDKNEDRDDAFRDDEVEDVHEETTDPGDRHVLAANSSDLGDRTDLVDGVDTADGVDPADEDDPEWFSDVESVSTIGSPEYSSDED
ncbi:hypothetical protein Droror1_Dr00025374 [Drosera rotundifolia]